MDPDFRMVLADLPFDWADKKLGTKSFFVANTGSRAWGTARPDSDYDFRLIGLDTTLDFINYPRATEFIKVEREVDGVMTQNELQFFSLQRFLGLASKSNLTAFETLYSPIYWGDHYIHEALQQLLDYSYDARELLRSCVGNVVMRRTKISRGESVQKVLQYKKQIFRYVFIGQQLLRIEAEDRGAYPFMNVDEYWKRHDGPTKYNESIKQAHAWAFEGAPEPQTMLNAFCKQDLPVQRKHALTERIEMAQKTFAYIMGRIGASYDQRGERFRETTWPTCDLRKFQTDKLFSAN